MIHDPSIIIVDYMSFSLASVTHTHVHPCIATSMCALTFINIKRKCGLDVILPVASFQKKVFNNMKQSQLILSYPDNLTQNMMTHNSKADDLFIQMNH